MSWCPLVGIKGCGCGLLESHNQGWEDFQVRISVMISCRESKLKDHFLALHKKASVVDYWDAGEGTRAHWNPRFRRNLYDWEFEMEECLHFEQDDFQIKPS